MASEDSPQARPYVEREIQYYHYGLQDIKTAASRIPRVGQPTYQFMTELDRESVHRPLVLVSQPNYEDPEVWKPYETTPDDIQSVIPTLRQEIPSIPQCDKAGRVVSRNDRYPDETVGLVKAYRSRLAEILIAVRLDRELFACGEGVEEAQRTAHWFHRGESGQVRFLGNEMEPVDAGDYDRDGGAEFMFMVKGYNRGGYRLFFDGFSRYAEFLWSAH